VNLYEYKLHRFCAANPHDNNYSSTGRECPDKRKNSYGKKSVIKAISRSLQTRIVKKGAVLGGAHQKKRGNRTPSPVRPPHRARSNGGERFGAPSHGEHEQALAVIDSSVFAFGRL
jgi:hypothetical protein